jgi:hypothetical protein
MLPTKRNTLFSGILLSGSLLYCKVSIAQNLIMGLAANERNSFWILPLVKNLQQYSVYHFRKTFLFKNKPIQPQRLPALFRICWQRLQV